MEIRFSTPAVSTDVSRNENRATERSENKEPSQNKSLSGKELTPDQEHEVEKLKQRDQEVKNHEQAHKAAGAGITGGATYTYTTGPDGKRYASGGEVSIDVSKEKSPEATISKMQKVRTAALAPADPSAQDYAVARKAQSITQQARKELAAENTQQNENSASPKSIDVMA